MHFHYHVMRVGDSKGGSLVTCFAVLLSICNSVAQESRIKKSAWELCARICRRAVVEEKQ